MDTNKKGGGTGPKEPLRRKPHAPYPPEFRAEAVRLVHAAGTSTRRVAKDLGVHEETLRLWGRQAAIDAGRRDGLTTGEREELARLRREHRLLKEGREILKKAATFFATEIIQDLNRDDGDLRVILLEAATPQRVFEEPPGSIHAGESETSRLLHIAPDLVRMDRAVNTDVPYTQSFLLYAPITDLEPTGVWGHAA